MSRRISHLCHTGSRGFSLLELSVVIVVMGLMSMAVAPALRTIDETRRIGAAEEVERRIANARVKARVMGRPVGVMLNPAAETSRTMTIASVGAAPTAMVGVMGEVEPEASIAALYPGAEIVSVISGAGTSGTQVIWFDFDGTPHERTSGGARLPAWTGDGTVVLSGGYTITIRRESGGIDR